MSALDTNGVLEGVVVLDLTQMLAGPYCTMVLADHGADVIKIEPPHGDMSRGMGPFAADDKAQCNGGYFHSINRNKRSMVLDLKQAEDRDIFLKLVDDADVVVENFRHGVMERLGIAYETLAARKPELVYAAIRGFGDERTGASPYKDWPAFDIVAQAMGGFMSMTGEPGQPMKAGAGIGDIVPGLMCAFGIVAGVRHAERSGEGQFIDVAMYDAMLALCERLVYRYSFDGTVSTGAGNDHPLVSPFSIFPAADGWYAIGCPLDSHWRELLSIMQREDLLNDERFSTNVARVTHNAEVSRLLSAWTQQFTRTELAARLGGLVPSGPVNDVSDIADDPHVKARNMLPGIEPPGLDASFALAGVPIHFSQTPGAVRGPGPMLGEHTSEVMEQFGITRVHGLGEET